MKFQESCDELLSAPRVMKGIKFAVCLSACLSVCLYVCWGAIPLKLLNRFD